MEDAVKSISGRAGSTRKGSAERGRVERGELGRLMWLAGRIEVVLSGEASRARPGGAL